MRFGGGRQREEVGADTEEPGVVKGGMEVDVTSGICRRGRERLDNPTESLFGDAVSRHSLDWLNTGTELCKTERPIQPYFVQGSIYA